MSSIVLLKSHLSRQGGAEKYTWRLASALQARHYEVTILTSGPTLPAENLNIISCPDASCSFRFVKQFDRFCENYLKNHPIPIIFGLDRNRHQTHLRASNGSHRAFLEERKKNEGLLKNLTFSLNPLHSSLLAIEKASFENPYLKCLITNSHMVKREILQDYRVDPTIIKVVHNGVEWKEMLSSFQAWPEARSSLLQKWGLITPTFHLLFVGNNYKRKGLEPLLKGLHLLLKNGTCDFHLSVIGKEKNIKKFQQLAAQLNLNNHVSFFGPKNDITPFYQMADALVIPSFYDPFANVTVEALSMGVPVISSLTNGGHEILTADNGFIIEALTDPFSMKAALEKAFKHPKTWKSSLLVRDSVSHLDFSIQLKTLLDRCAL